MVTVQPHLQEELVKVVGDSLRVLATHDQRVYEFQYRREDIRAGYTDEEFRQIFDDLVFQGMEREYFEQLFHVGSLECGAWGFTDAAIFYFPGEAFTGLVVSVDRDGPIDFDRLINICRDGFADSSS